MQHFQSNVNCLLSCIAYSLLFVLLGCNNERKEVSANICKLTNHDVIVPYDKLLLYEGRYALYEYTMLEPLNLVVYVDNSECSSCYLSNIQRWEPFLDSLRLNYDYVRTTILFTPSNEVQNSFFEKLRYTKFKYPLYIDTCNVFSRTNRHIPSNKMYHTFLIDENNKVILVGNPLTNKKINKMFWKILDENRNKY